MLTDFRLSVLEKNLGVYGVTVVKSGKIIARHDFRVPDAVHVFSVSKTFTSMSIGILYGNKLINLDDKVLDFFPEYKEIATEGSEDITVRNLLHMSSGHMTTGIVTTRKDNNNKIDYAEDFFKTPMLESAGKEFTYENSCTYMLSRIVNKITGKNLLDFMIPKFFGPLGIDYPIWSNCPMGYTIGAFGLHLTTEEISRLGVLMLNGGVYNEKQIVPKDYIEKSINDTREARWSDPEGSFGYGYQLWRNSIDGSYRADGKYGQYCIIFTDRDAVVSVTSHFEGNQNDILRAVYKDIYTKL
ncbi:MAG: beta-lactamase family protein [Defluviitaleaceae bacterium]|nr:beta-lactamase family protein [Defluviitaleaceae bacterium]